MQAVALIDEENGRFGVSFPDFPGCTTVAASLDEAAAKAGEVLAFHAEGLAEDGPLPVPRTLTQLMSDREFREACRRSIAVLVPYAPPARAVRINVTVDESLLARIDRAAEAAGESRSGYLAEASKQRLANNAQQGLEGGIVASAESLKARAARTSGENTRRKDRMKG
jgi:predicted RNase H-like HicB family nuclease